MIGDVIKLDEPRSKSLAEPFHHTSDSGNIVVGGTDEGEKALNGVLSQESYTWGQKRRGRGIAPAVGVSSSYTLRF